MATADFSRIATNIGALNALQSLNNINSKLGIHQQRLATGKRINSAADDPAGLTIATKLNARAEGLKVAGDNIADAQNLLSVTESGLGRINDIMTQMRNKAEQAASDTIGAEERDAILTQMNAYAAQIDDLVDQTTWNGNKLLDGLASFASNQLTFQTGAEEGDTTVLSGLIDVSASGTMDIATTSGGSLTLATTAQSGTTDLDLTGAAISNANLTEVSGGGFTAKVTFGADKNADITVELLDANGDAVMIDADGDTSTDAIDTSMTLSSATFSAAFDTDGTIDLGNGLEVNLSGTTDFVAAATTTASASVTNSGTAYEVKLTGGAVLTSASTAADFSAYMTDLDDAMDKVSGELSKVGALMGRLGFKAEQVATAQVNVESSYNRIMNADMAFEQLEATKYSILQQTSTTMLAQANTAPQGILSLFR